MTIPPNGVTAASFIRIKLALQEKGVALRFIRPVYITHSASITFYPRQIDTTGRLIRTINCGRGQNLQAPVFQNREEFANHAAGEFGKAAGDLVRQGATLLMEGGDPSQLHQVQMAEILGVKDQLERDLVYLKQERLYVLIEGLGGRLAMGKSSLIPFQTSTGTQYVTAFNNGQALLDLLSKPAADPAAEQRADVTMRFRLLPDEEMQLIRSEPLPPTSVVAGQHRNLLSTSDKRACGFSDLGNKRKNNEDAFLMDEESQLYVVADGMGGHGAGERASEIAVRIIHGDHKRGRSVLEAISLAQDEITREAQEDITKKGMGTTVVAAKIEGNQAAIACIGDSRVYLNGTLITKDHSLSVESLEHLLKDQPQEGESQALTELREITSGVLNWPLEGKILTLFETAMREEPILRNNKNIVTRALGQHYANPDLLQVPLQDKDWLLLCSDGLTDELLERTHQIINDCRRKGMAVQETARLLRKTVLEGAAKDNVTIVLYEHRIAEEKTTVFARVLIQLEQVAKDRDQLMLLLGAIIAGQEPIPPQAIAPAIEKVNEIMNASQERDPEVYSKALEAMSVLATKL